MVQDAGASGAPSAAAGSTTAAGAISGQLENALRTVAEAAGGQVAPVSLSVEYLSAEREITGSHAAVTRATRSLVFATATLTAADGEVVAAGDGVFRVTRARD